MSFFCFMCTLCINFSVNSILGDVKAPRAQVVAAPSIQGRNKEEQVSIFLHVICSFTALS